jgi:hypothetical protein
MSLPEIVSREQWREARVALLEQTSTALGGEVRRPARPLLPAAASRGVDRSC